MTSCTEIRENICAYIDNELEMDQRLSFEEHIRNCNDCRLELEEMTHIVGLCTDLPQLELPQGFKEELHEKLTVVAGRQEHFKTNTRKPKHLMYIRTYASIAAGILLIFLAGSFYKYGLFVPGKAAQDSTKSAAMAAGEQAARAEGVMDNSMADITAAEKNAGVEAKSFGASAAAETGSIGADRSSASENREIGIASADGQFNAEKADSKHATITVITANPDEQMEKIKALAIENGGEAVEDTIVYSFSTSTSSNSEQPAGANMSAMDENSGAAVQNKLNYRIPDTQYEQFINNLNALFGEANVQRGALVTEDLTTVLDSSIEKSGEIDSQMQELQKKDVTKNAQEISRLKEEKESVTQQIEQIRLGSDFTNVTLYIYAK